MKTFAPRKAFSQNFLTDGRTAAKIAATLEVGPSDVVLEIGPGPGALTEHLVRTGSHVTAIDLDERAVAHLRQQAWAGNVDIRYGDILTCDLTTLWPGTERHQRNVIGNIPYAITSEILFWLFDGAENLRRAVIMMQREVAERLVAQPRTKEYGVLTVAASLVSTPRLMFHVKPGSFFPRPSVTSSVVRFDFHDQLRDLPFRRLFMVYVRAAFSQRRKVLANSLKTWATSTLKSDLRELASIVITSTGVDIMTARAEELTMEQHIEVYFALINEHHVSEEGKGHIRGI